MFPLCGTDRVLVECRSSRQTSSAEPVAFALSATMSHPSGSGINPRAPRSDHRHAHSTSPRVPHHGRGKPRRSDPAIGGPSGPGSSLLAPWGVQLAGSFSKAAAIAAYASRRAELAAVLRDEPPMVIGGRAPGRGFRPFYRVRFPAPSRPAASAMCDRIMRLGGACSVSKSRSMSSRA